MKDPENMTEEERAEHAAAVEQWERTRHLPPWRDPHGIIAHNLAMIARPYKEGG